MLHDVDQVARVKARLQGFVGVSRRDALTHAFRALRKRGYFARQHFQCCQSCGWDAVPDDKGKRAVFYHAQDAHDLRTREQCYLAWAGAGHEIVDVLLAHGVIVTWDGSPTTRILISVKETA